MTPPQDQLKGLKAVWYQTVDFPPGIYEAIVWELGSWSDKIPGQRIHDTARNHLLDSEIGSGFLLASLFSYTYIYLSSSPLPPHLLTYIISSLY